MKGIVSILLALLIGVLSPLPLYAQEAETLLGDKLSLKVGYKVWFAYWSAPQLQAPQLQSDGVSALNGPTGTLTYRIRENDWLNSAFISTTWLNGGFNFQPIQTNTITGPPFAITDTAIQNQAALRRDYSITAGLAIWRGFGILAGYYNKRDQFNETSLDSGFGPSPSPTTRIMDGPIIGLFGNTELTERVNMYGNLSYAFLNMSTGGPRTFQCLELFGCGNSTNAKGYSGEFGAHLVGPAIWKITPELQIGYRFQVIQTTLPPGIVLGLPISGGTSVNDLTHGPIFTVSARF